MHLGRNIKLARVAKGYTQDDLGEKVNRSRTLISYIEKTGKVNFYTLRTICEALDVTLEDMETVDRTTFDPQGPYLLKMNGLEEENERLKQEIKDLRSFISSQKQIISALQKKK